MTEPTTVHEQCGQPLEAHTLGPNGKAECPAPDSRVDAEVLRQQVAPMEWLFGRSDPAPDSPVPGQSPPIYTVVSFRVQLGGKVYDYAAVRAGDGKWYATGGQTRQGVDWETLVRAVRPRLVGPIQVLAPIRSLFV